MKFILRVYTGVAILLVIAACAAPKPRFRDESMLAREKVRVSGMETLFPLEAKDLYSTVNQGNAELAKGEISAADAYYGLALGKAGILDKLYRKELQRRDEEARIEIEKKRRAEAELKLQKQMEAEELAREAARIKLLEAEKTNGRRKADKIRQEKELLPVSRHTVKRGETFPQIAAQPEVYGDASLWPLIYKANRDQISNPAVLWPGQVLRIPRNADKNEINEARRFAAERALR